MLLLAIQVCTVSFAQVGNGRKKKSSFNDLLKKAAEKHAQKSQKSNNGPSNGKVKMTARNYYIQSALEYGRSQNGYWDLPGVNPKAKNGQNLAVYKMDKGDDRKYWFKWAGDGNYTIRSLAGYKYCVDLSHGRTNNGSNIGMHEANRTDAQLFYLKHLGNGRFKIHHISGKILALAGRSSSNGSNIHLWDDHNSISNEWYLIDSQTKKPLIPTEFHKPTNRRQKGTKMLTDVDFKIQSAMEYNRGSNGYWDLPGKDPKISMGMSLKLYKLDRGGDRYYKIKKEKNSQYYNIQPGNVHDGRLDVKGGKSKKGADMHIWRKHSGKSQQFYFKHLGNGRFKIYHMSGRIVCPAGRRSSNGTNVHLWDDHNGIYTEWYLIKKNGRPYIPN